MMEVAWPCQGRVLHRALIFIVVNCLNLSDSMRVPLEKYSKPITLDPCLVHSLFRHSL